MKYGNGQTLWRLPDGMDEMLPQQAQALEWLRRTVYDLHVSWGYQPVEPPVVEFLESLLSGTGRDFERQTFKIADPLSGRMMGLRADMTPQVARIDEIFGHSGPQSDVEIIRLMIAALQCAGIDDIHLDLGHVGVFRSICEQIEMNGDKNALQQAKGELTGGALSSEHKLMSSSLLELETISESLQGLPESISIHFDLAEIRGYQYHTGVVFAAYTPGASSEIG